MKYLIALTFAVSILSCSKERLSTNEQALQNEVAGAKNDPGSSQSQSSRLAKAIKVLLSSNSTGTVSEITVVNQTTGVQTYAYVIGETDNTASIVDGGGISGGWILHNDGCFYHGTIYTGSNGVYIFIEDPNPYTDNYIGNEPRCGNSSLA